ncbi:MAG: hypothetical protein HKN88_09795 [Gammaproteobacteria bacterium]|nr:hypothetical protein [Gammaproteobacteria bacterium]NNC98349.1 hypothetical protein [Gammaproteobacteria bacterium]NNM13736.1 hypothetical protein [Gammaproteobacteria bacterium]
MKVNDLCPQGITDEDLDYQGSRYAEVKEAVFANPYQRVWGAPGEPPFPHHAVTTRGVYEGFLPGGKPDQFKQAAIRTLKTSADLRWGEHAKGFRKLIHSNGVCMTGTWEITNDNEFSGFFKKSSKGKIITRLSCGSSAIKSGNKRAFGFAGKLYPTMDENHQELLKPASFFCLDSLSGNDATHYTDVTLLNGIAVRILDVDLPGKLMLLRAGIVFGGLDKNGSLRQVYQIAELDKAPDEACNAPEFMCLVPSEGHLTIDEEDFRDELLGHIYDKGNPVPQRTLCFDILVSNQGKEVGNAVTGSKFEVTDWHKIGKITLEDGVASHNADHVLHFTHPPWRNDRNDPDSVAKKNIT